MKILKISNAQLENKQKEKNIDNQKEKDINKLENSKPNHIQNNKLLTNNNNNITDSFYNPNLEKNSTKKNKKIY